MPVISVNKVEKEKRIIGKRGLGRRRGASFLAPFYIQIKYMQ
jgi:hypothetical protein